MHTSLRWLLVALAALVAGCGSAGNSNVEVIVTTDASTARDAGRVVGGGVDASRPTFDVQALDRPARDVQPNYDAFFAQNPLPMFCGPDGGGVDAGPPPALPGGTAACPDDLTREGCPCDTPGQMHSCWPGLRVNRNRGICHDGMTTCVAFDELGGRWGPCMNFTLPDPHAMLGPGACQCFSAGRWELTNLTPCFYSTGPGATTAVAISSYLDAHGTAQCPPVPSGGTDPVPQPGSNFTANYLTVDCTGEFQLCYVLRAGDGAHPNASDCVVARVCTSAWYATPNARQAFPPLPSWTASDRACAARFLNNGGYGEMTVQGVSSECQHIDNGGAPYVFNRVTYCPASCSSNPTAPGCSMCGNGGSGGF